jgi:hypothetical protein
LSTLIRNTKTNVVDLVPDHYLDHPILGADIVALEQEVAPVSTKKQSKVEEPVAAETTTE